MLFFNTIKQADLNEELMSVETDSTLSCIEINPRDETKHTVIWLHGLGADGSDFVPIVNELRLPNSMGMRFVFPSAPIIPITINNGYEMRAWYDISSGSLQGNVDKAGIHRSIKSIHQLIKNEILNGVKSTNIVLAGFSQGGAMALTVGLGFPEKLGGIIALSAYLPLMGEVLQAAAAANEHTPIFIGHGMEDVLVPYALGKSVSVALKQAGYSVSWHSYPVEHSVCGDEILDVGQWLQGLWMGGSPPARG